MVIENQEVHFNNLVSLRGEFTQQEVANVMKELETFTKEHELIKTGPIITTTYLVHQSQTPKMDLEILLPVEGNIPGYSKFKHKEKLHLVNALKITHKGNPSLMKKSMELLEQYILNKHLAPITSAYYITRKDIKDQNQVDELEVDIYIGINPNVV